MVVARLGIPLAIWVIGSVDIPWFWVVGLVLIALGAAGVMRALTGPKG